MLLVLCGLPFIPAKIAFACSGGGISTVGELVSSAAIIAKGRITQTDTAHINAKVQVDEYFKGNSDKDALLLVQSDPLFFAIHRDFPSPGGCRIPGKRLEVGEVYYLFINRNPDGSYTPIEVNQFDVTLYKVLPNAKVERGEQVNDVEFRQQIESLSGSSVQPPKGKSAYVLTTPLLIRTTTGNYLLPVDGEPPSLYSGSTDALVTNKRGCANVNCTAVSASGLFVGRFTEDGASIRTNISALTANKGEQQLGRAFLFSSVRNQAVIWNDHVLALYDLQAFSNHVLLASIPLAGEPSSSLQGQGAWSVVQTINAGVDLIMLAEEHYDHDASTYIEQQTALLRAVKEAIENGQLSMQRLDQAVGCVLHLKQARGLLATSLPEGSIATVGSEAHCAVEMQVSRQAVALLRGEASTLPLAREAQIVLINTTLRASYATLNQTRGIGPNPDQSAFDHLEAAMREKFSRFRVISAEAFLAGEATFSLNEKIVAVTENYPLPGMDFDQRSQSQIISDLHSRFGARLIIVALRDPYELAALPAITTYLCAFSFRPSAARAAAEALAGEVVPSGKTPVSAQMTA